MAAYIIFVMAFVNAAMALPSSDPTDPSCIAMTPENKAKLDTMMNEIVDFLAQLSSRNPEFDITSIKLKVDRHYYNDDMDKDTEMEFTVNDCRRADDKAVADEFDTYTITTDGSVTNDDKPSNTDSTVDAEVDVYNIDTIPNPTDVAIAQPIKESEIEISEISEISEVVWLDLPENGKEMMRYLKKRRGEKPFLMYMNGLPFFQLLFP